jgi:hypothetical protein
MLFVLQREIHAHNPTLSRTHDSTSFSHTTHTLSDVYNYLSHLPYQIWDTAQAFCSTVTGMLAAKAMLTGMGVGNETASVGAALWYVVGEREGERERG